MTDHHTHRKIILLYRNNLNYIFRWQFIISKFKRNYITGSIKNVFNYDYLRRSMLSTIVKIKRQFLEFEQFNLISSDGKYNHNQRVPKRGFPLS